MKVARPALAFLLVADAVVIAIVASVSYATGWRWVGAVLIPALVLVGAAQSERAYRRDRQQSR